MLHNLYYKIDNIVTATRRYDALREKLLKAEKTNEAKEGSEQVGQMWRKGYTMIVYHRG